MGRLSPDPAECISLYKEGYDVICYGGDLWVYQKALIDGITAVRDGCTPGKAAKGAKKK